MSGHEDCVDLSTLLRLPTLIGKVNHSRTLADTVQAVVDGVVEVVGFDVAAVSYAHPDGTFEVLAVSGDAEARAQLVGQRIPAGTFEREFALAESWGELRFVPHERLPGGRGEGWVPPVEPLEVPDAWHPQDALFAPLRSAAGEVVGMLSVDLPRDRRRPAQWQRNILQIFAAQAGIAIDNARLIEQLQASERAFRVAFERAGIGMALVSLSPADPGRYLRVNVAFCRLLGRTEEELLGLRFSDITHPDDRARDIDALRDAVAGGPQVYQVEKRYLHADGSSVWVAVTSSVALTANGGDSYVITQVEDITDRRAVREELSHRVSHDHLTGLPNRATLEARLAIAAQAARLNASEGALLFCDLDQFKTVNDTYGHDIGDLVLVEVARRLTDASRRDDTVARLGGDEFVVLAEDITRHHARQLADRLSRAVARPVHVDDVSVSVTVSVGIAYIDEGTDPDAVLRAADTDMYSSKRARHREAGPPHPG